MRKTQHKENRPFVIIAIVILYTWQFLNFWMYQDLTNHYLECCQENVELRQKVLELRQEVLDLHQDSFKLFQHGKENYTR